MTETNSGIDDPTNSSKPGVSDRYEGYSFDGDTVVYDRKHADSWILCDVSVDLCDVSTNFVDVR